MNAILYLLSKELLSKKTIILLADPSTEMIQAFGAWGEKKLYGRPYMGTLRLTFIFDENGILTDIIEKVDTKNHAEQILK